ncbi:hypothetical protein Dsin_002444 [Dipteronia sinensis]|uniref:MATH domain-containing protein n=1 Tax=Dipteronia sinensis TaxID=43782 RepID=A0AAE0B5U1_9ROSI|nr:hypothetical protein Dsin_002444 [Dipteronia sinensis]
MAVKTEIPLIIPIKHIRKLILYPNGNSDHGNGHISLYLAIDKPIGIDNWRIPVNFKLFVLNQITNQYLTIQDGSAVTDFHEQKPERGFRQFLSLQEFKNPSKGYLVNDCCTFGAEVFVLKPSPQKEILTMKRPADGKSYIWNIKKFSQLNDVQLSTEISVEGRKWTVSLYPKGNGSGSGEYLHLSMNLADWERVSPKRNVYAQYKLQVLGVNNVERESCHWFNSEDGWGYDLMLLKDIYKLPNGYLKDDTLTVHVEFQVISVTSSAEK